MFFPTGVEIANLPEKEEKELALLEGFNIDLDKIYTDIHQWSQPPPLLNTSVDSRKPVAYDNAFMSQCAEARGLYHALMDKATPRFKVMAKDKVNFIQDRLEGIELNFVKMSQDRIYSLLQSILEMAAAGSNASSVATEAELLVSIVSTEAKELELEKIMRNGGL